MKQPAPSLKAVLQSVRELTMDRFAVPGITFKANPGTSLYIDSAGIHLTGPAPSSTPPTANAGDSQPYVLPYPIPTGTIYAIPPSPALPPPNFVEALLDGSGSAAAAGRTLTGFHWSCISGTDVAEIAEPNSLITFARLAEGRYTFQLTVVDDAGITASSWVKIVVVVPNDILPKANAGADMHILNTQMSVNLDGSSGSISNLGAIAAYSWAKLSGPLSGTIVSPSAANTAVNGLVTGVYEFGLTVTDVEGQTNTDIISILVSPPNTIHYLFSEFPTFQDLVDQLMLDGVPFGYSLYFNGQELTKYLIPVKPSVPLSADYLAPRTYFFSDNEVMNAIVFYYYDVLGLNIVLEDLQSAIPLITPPGQYHLALWVAYHMVDKRRRYEAAASVIANQNGSIDPSGAGAAFGDDSVTIDVQIGDVFKIHNDPQSGFLVENFGAVGSDNVWGDRYSFWYKLMLYLRSRLETDFGDYSLRMDTVFEGGIVLEKAQNYRTYFDSYPFTLSPLSRQIITYSPGK